jgi:hypothetical protein
MNQNARNLILAAVTAVPITVTEAGVTLAQSNLGGRPNSAFVTPANAHPRLSEFRFSHGGAGGSIVIDWKCSSVSPVLPGRGHSVVSGSPASGSIVIDSKCISITVVHSSRGRFPGREDD